MRTLQDSLAAQAPTLADLKALPLEVKSSFLLGKLAKIDANRARLLRREELAGVEDSFELSSEYPPEESQAVREHLIAAPWTRLVEQGFLIPLQDPGVFLVSEKGISSLIHAEAPLSPDTAQPTPGERRPPRAFVSYAWESPSHIEWVRKLAERLQGQGGVEVILDQWHLVPGTDRLHFMEQSIATSDFVIAVCTPGYAARADKRDGGVGYESMVITSSLGEKILEKKFIPALREGTWGSSVPLYLRSKLGVDLSKDPYDEQQFKLLLRALHQQPIKPPTRKLTLDLSSLDENQADAPGSDGTNISVRDTRASPADETGRGSSLRRHATAGPSPQVYLQGVIDSSADLYFPGPADGNRLFISIDSAFIEIPFQVRDNKEDSQEAQTKTKLSITEELRRRQRVFLVGGLGSGKSTILKKIAKDFAASALSTQSPSIPILIRASELIAHIDRFLVMRDPGPDVPSSKSAPLWISHYAWKHYSKDRGAGYDIQFFESSLRGEGSLLLVDGLDEVPIERIQPLLAGFHNTYRKVSVILSGRSSALFRLQPFNSFSVIELLDFTGRDRRRFLQWWSGIRLPIAPHKAQEFVSALIDALQKDRTLDRIAATPLTLTMLCPQWLMRRQLAIGPAALYEQLIAGNPEPVLWERLQGLALAMQTHRRGKRFTVSIGWAADRIADSENANDNGPLQDALRSYATRGMISLSGSDLRFWHISFQDFLASRALARMPERRQNQTLLAQELALLHEDWHDTLTMLVEILSANNAERVDGLADLLGDMVGKAPSYGQKAAGLVLLERLASTSRQANRRELPQVYDDIYQQLRATVFLGETTTLDPELRVRFVRCFGSIQDPRTTNLEWVQLPSRCIESRSTRPRFANDNLHAPSEELSVKTVELPAFAITRLPVTVAQYREFVLSGGYVQKSYWAQGGFQRYKEPAGWEEQLEQLNCPVRGVSWFEAAAFCAWAGTHLPSEAEWEWAAAGVERRVFPWGSEPPDNNRCWFAAREKYLAPVGIFPAGQTPEGMLDLAGNTWEWTSDQYSQEEPEGEISGRQTVTPATRMVIKGGSNTCSAAFLTNSGRAWATAESRYSNFGFVGFRCARRSS